MLDIPEHRPSPEWARLRLWATGIRESVQDAAQLLAVLDLGHDLRRRNPALAQELWSTAQQLELRIKRRLSQEGNP